jgi:AhpD family alkylhydroperoxidase
VKISEIDPALGQIKSFNKITAGVADRIQEMRSKYIFSNGAVEAKHKAMSAALWSISSRCEPCITYYVQQAVKLGATEAELGEYLAIAGTMGGCVGEMWALKAYVAFQNLQAHSENQVEAAEHCCN